MKFITVLTIALAFVLGVAIHEAFEAQRKPDAGTASGQLAVTNLVVSTNRSKSYGYIADLMLEVRVAYLPTSDNGLAWVNCTSTSNHTILDIMLPPPLLPPPSNLVVTPGKSNSVAKP